MTPSRTDASARLMCMAIVGMVVAVLESAFGCVPVSNLFPDTPRANVRPVTRGSQRKTNTTENHIMKTSHTPGPWQIDPEIDHAITTQSGLRIAEVATYGAGLVSIGEIAPWHHYEANARLIAAAPELLEALQEVLNPAVAALRALDRYPEPMETDPLFSALELVRAAIVKATRSPSGDTQP